MPYWEKTRQKNGNGNIAMKTYAIKIYAYKNN